MADIEKMRVHAAELAEKHNLLIVALFGSQVSKKTHSQSDTDIAFLAERKMSLMDIAKMQEGFSSVLGIKEIEFVSLNDAPPFLLKQIAQNSVILYEKEKSAFARFKIYAYKRFMEAKPLLKLRVLSFNNFLNLQKV